jgi:hypothetical protein
LSRIKKKEERLEHYSSMRKKLVYIKTVEEKIQKKMTELKNEKPELFDNIEITDEYREQILVTLDGFYTEKSLQWQT